MTDPTSTLTRVSPELAAQWLLLVPDSYRPLSDSAVAKLSRQMAQGKWRIIGSTAVSFVGSLANDTAILVDGRRTLAAIVEAGTPIDLFVAENVSEDADLVTNTSSPIGLGDYLMVHRKTTNKFRLASLVHLTYAAMNGMGDSFRTARGLFTHEEMLDFFDAHPGFPEILREADNIHHQLPDGASISALGAAMMIFGELDAVAAADFFTRLRNDEIELLRRFYVQNSKLDPHYRASQQLAALIKVWNGERTRERPYRNTARWLPTEESYPVAV